LGEECKARRFDLIPQIERLLDDQSPLVRAMAVWALARLDGERFCHLREKQLAKESDPAVRQEWLMAA
jgi:epoxyqueuosine reductase